MYVRKKSPENAPQYCLTMFMFWSDGSKPAGYSRGIFAVHCPGLGTARTRERKATATAKESK